MAQQKADYPLDYSRGADRSKAEGRGSSGDSTADQLGKAADTAQEIAAQIAEHARAYGEKAQELARNARPMVDKSMKEQPMTTLAAAAVVGFVLGALWKK